VTYDRVDTAWDDLRAEAESRRRRRLRRRREGKAVDIEGLDDVEVNAFLEDENPFADDLTMWALS
jgi:hypothetical protein